MPEITRSEILTGLGEFHLRTGTQPYFEENSTGVWELRDELDDTLIASGSDDNTLLAALNPIVTPESFESRMASFVGTNEEKRVLGIDLMKRTLRILGYGAGIDVFESF